MSAPESEIVKKRSVARPVERDGVAYHHGALRDALIAEGRRQVNEVGAHALSLRGLVRAVGVSIAASSYHFDDKEGLLAAIATDGFNRLASMRAAIPATTADPVERVYRIMESYVQFAKAEKGLFNMMVGSQILKRPHKELSTARAASFELFATAVCDLALLKGWPQEDLNLVVHAAWAVEHGLASLLLAQRAPFTRRKVDSDEMVKFSLSLLLSGISAGPNRLRSIEKRTQQ
jgi:AcrR family transcriptional regulator